MLKTVTNNEGKYIITDYVSPFRIDKIENVFELNDFIFALVELNNNDLEGIYYLINCVGYQRDQAMASYKDVTFYPDISLEDVAKCLAENKGVWKSFR